MEFISLVRQNFANFHDCETGEKFIQNQSIFSFCYIFLGIFFTCFFQILDAALHNVRSQSLAIFTLRNNISTSYISHSEYMYITCTQWIKSNISQMKMNRFFILNISSVYKQIKPHDESLR